MLLERCIVSLHRMWTFNPRIWLAET